MLPNEEFALACRAKYEQMGLVVDKRNGQFAHCPYPKGMGETGYYLLWEDHQHQGLLQSKDMGKRCFFQGHAKKWLKECHPIPEKYFELWEIYEEFISGSHNPMFGKPRPKLTEEGRERIRQSMLGNQWNVGKKLSPERVEKIREVHRGKTVSEETRRKISESKKGKSSEKIKESAKRASDKVKGTVWWNNGEVSKRSKECPGEGWVKGRLPLSKDR